MKRDQLRIGLIGDFDPTVPAHRAIPLALELSAAELAIKVQPHWLPTDQITDDSPLAEMDALWCVPASPYRSMEGALRAIRFARENQVPFLGTCGGFQHALIEYARNVLGWADADHAETSPGAPRLVITPLVCALREKTGAIHIRPGTKLAAAYQTLEVTEGYHCGYGLNPEFRWQLEAGGMNISAVDIVEDVRAVELSDHPFFVATLFQPERAALTGKLPPLVRKFVEAAMISCN